MTDLSQMIRWNANFVRGLAQSVLERARVIRESLTPTRSGSNPRDAATPAKRAGVRTVKVRAAAAAGRNVKGAEKRNGGRRRPATRPGSKRKNNARKH